MPNGKPPVLIGHILILRTEFDHIAQNPNQSLANIRRATLLVAALDELLEFREKEAVNDADGN